LNRKRSRARPRPRDDKVAMFAACYSDLIYREQPERQNLFNVIDARAAHKYCLLENKDDLLAR
jgi:hypothetical protein